MNLDKSLNLTWPGFSHLYSEGIRLDDAEEPFSFAISINLRTNEIQTITTGVSLPI